MDKNITGRSGPNRSTMSVPACAAHDADASLEERAGRYPVGYRAQIASLAADVSLNWVASVLDSPVWVVRLQARGWWPRPGAGRRTRLEEAVVFRLCPDCRTEQDAEWERIEQRAARRAARRRGPAGRPPWED